MSIRNNFSQSVKTSVALTNGFRWIVDRSNRFSRVRERTG